MTAKALIRTLSLEPHPEGGWYREIYRSPERVFPSSVQHRFDGERSLATSILFLLESAQVSHLHRLAADEIWFFHQGAPLTLHQLEPDGAYRTTVLGPDPFRGESLHYVVPHGTWFGATLEREEAFALVSCVVAPGFEFRDFTLGMRDELLTRFPGHAAIIARLTP